MHGNLVDYGKFFDVDYYERGLESGKSAYQNYRWTPELTIPMAMTIIDYLGIKRNETILDYGCAKGFLVRAFKLLGRDAYGADISEYAIGCVGEDVMDRCILLEDVLDISHVSNNPKFCIAKDVFEHVEEKLLDPILKELQSKIMFVVVPLGDNGRWRAPSNSLDKSHINCFPESWWSDRFRSCGWAIKDFRFRIEGIKDSYYRYYPESHGFYVLEKS